MTVGQRDLVATVQLPGDTSGITKVMSVFDGMENFSFPDPGAAPANPGRFVATPVPPGATDAEKAVITANDLTRMAKHTEDVRLFNEYTERRRTYDDIQLKKQEIIRQFYGINTTPPASGQGLSYPQNRGLAIQVGGIANVVNTTNKVIMVNTVLVVDFAQVTTNMNSVQRWMLQFRPVNPLFPDEFNRRRAVAMSDASPGDIFQVKLIG